MKEGTLIGRFFSIQRARCGGSDFNCLDDPINMFVLLSRGTFTGLAINTCGAIVFYPCWVRIAAAKQGKADPGYRPFWATTVTYLCLCGGVDADP